MKKRKTVLFIITLLLLGLAINCTPLETNAQGLFSCPKYVTEYAF